MSDRLTYVASLSDPRWASAEGVSARLVFDYLSIASADPQGLIVQVPRLAGQTAVKSHFASVTKAMLGKATPTSCTEAVGEAAAAMAILDTFPAYDLEQGFDAGSGPGIDQIWVMREEGTIRKVLIVEAKGPGATENNNAFMPPDFEQMSSNWIVHNLATMMQAGKRRSKDDPQGKLAAEIVTGAGLKVGICYPGYNGASKNYYGVMAISSEPRIKIDRVTVQADWQADGMLSYRIHQKPALTSFAITDVSHARNIPIRPIVFP